MPSTTLRLMLPAFVFLVAAGRGLSARAQEPPEATPAATPERPKVWAPTPVISEEEKKRILSTLLLFAQGDPDSGPPPLKVKFDVEIYEGDEAVKPKFEWNFGDGSPLSREKTPTHTYKQVGKYLVTVRAKDATGRGGKDEVPIYVEEPD